MKVLFHQSRKIDGKIFEKSKAPHELDDKYKKHWFFRALVKAGDVQPVLDLPPDEDLDASEAGPPSEGRTAASVALGKGEAPKAIESEDDEDVGYQPKTAASQSKADTKITKPQPQKAG